MATKRPRRCFIFGCENSKTFVEHHEQRRCFRPSVRSSEEIRQQWVNNIPPKKIGDGQLLAFNCSNSQHTICELHFEKDCFKKEDLLTINGEKVSIPWKRWRLTPNAVPTKFLGKKKKKQDKRRKGLRKCAKRTRSSYQSESQCVSPEPLDEDPPPPPSPISQRTSIISSNAAVSSQFKKSYFCSICLEQFTAGLDIFKELKSRGAVYLQFIRVMAKYLGLDFQSVESKFRDEYNRGNQKMLLSSIDQSLCHHCVGSAERICKLFQEAECIKMKLNSDILKVIQMLDNREWLTRKEDLLGKVDWDKINGVLLVNDGIKGKKNEVCVPKIRLRRSDCSNEENISKMLRKENSKKQNDSGLYSGRLSLVNLLQCDILVRCPFCEKCFSSKVELREHKQAYHLRKFSITNATTTPPPAIQIENETESGSTNSGEAREKSRDTLCSLPPPFPSSPKSLHDAVALSTVNNDFPSNCHGNNDTEDNSPPEPLSGDVANIPTPTLVLNDTLLGNENQNGFNQDDDCDQMMSPCASPVDDGDGDMYQEDEPIPPTEPPETSVPTPTEQVSESITTTEEPKQEVVEEEESSIPKKVPFMSSEYIGKYKVVCKLRNLTTGKTCVGVVAKARGSVSVVATTSSSTTPAADINAKERGVSSVVSAALKSLKKHVKKVKQRKDFIPIPPLPGPPYKCPVEACKREYAFKSKCIHHYRMHKRRLNEINRRIESGELVQKPKEKRIRKRKQTFKSFKTDHPQVTDDDKLINPDGDENNTADVRPASKKGKLYEHRCEVQGCRHIFKKKICLDFHVSCNHTPLQCHFCSEALPNLVQLIKHETLEHHSSSGGDQEDNDNQQQTCPRCDFQPANKNRAMRDHYAVIHYQLKIPERVNVYRPSCPLCDNRPFFSLEKYTTHMTKYHQEGQAIVERELPYKCEKCDKRFRLQLSLGQHQKIEHEGKGRASRSTSVFVCHICSKSYMLRYRYQNHMRSHSKNVTTTVNVHDDQEASLMCTDCGAFFKREGTLWRHKVSFHNQQQLPARPPTNEKVPERRLKVKPTIICALCGVECTNEKSLKHHMKTLHPDTDQAFNDPPNEYICHECGKIFLQNRTLKLHMRYHQVKPQKSSSQVVCQFCGKSWQNKGFLQVHMEKVHPEEAAAGNYASEGGHRCKQCGRVFALPQRLKHHVLRMHGSEPKIAKPKQQIPCPFCDKVWPNRGFLKYHLRRVHPERAAEFETDPKHGWTCEGCGKVYAVKSCLKTHLEKYCTGNPENKDD